MDSNFLSSKGFSLLELSIVMGAVAVLSMAVLPMAVRLIQIKAVEKTATEVTLIQDAAKRFFRDHGAWPSDLKIMQEGEYIAKGWALLNPWKNIYQV